MSRLQAQTGWRRTPRLRDCIVNLHRLTHPNPFAREDGEILLEQKLCFSPKEAIYDMALPASVSGKQSVLAFSIWKAGSTLLFEILRAMCRSVELVYFSPDDTLFEDGTDYRPWNIGRIFLDIGYCYGGFRIFPLYPVPLLGTARTILLVRDPRDILVSLYFSVRDSHTLPPANSRLAERLIDHREFTKSQSIDDWVLENHGLIMAAFEGYLMKDIHRRDNAIIYRYEDIIFRKRQWIADIADWYGWDLAEETIDQISTSFDVVPEQEQPDQHIRQVHPGNFKRHLSPATQSRIEGIFRQYLETFGY